MNELIEKVKQWSIEKGLDHAEPSKQFLKVTEEVGEVAAALARDDMEELQDAIGDTIVTLIILAQQHEMEVEECLEQAYNAICGRTGRMINGVFVKEEDLKNATIMYNE
ncbi:MAG TPA: MazG-like family protein [Kurthia gibsonii]|nr:MazG-like family protein [Kurthia gibsonii]